MKATDFTRGMMIRGRDDVELGELVEVWAETASHGHLPVSRYLLQDYGPVKGNSGWLNTEEGYLQVRQEAFMGFGGRDIFVPLSQVQEVASGTSAILRYPADMCQERFSSRPEELRPAA